MKAIKFKHSNVTYAKDQKACNQLPALALGDPAGHVVTCWKMGWLERLKVIFTGKVWLDTMTFNQNLQPLNMSVHRDDVYKSKPLDDAPVGEDSKTPDPDAIAVMSKTKDTREKRPTVATNVEDLAKAGEKKSIEAPNNEEEKL